MKKIVSAITATLSAALCALPMIAAPANAASSTQRKTFRTYYAVGQNSRLNGFSSTITTNKSGEFGGFRYESPVGRVQRTGSGTQTTTIHVMIYTANKALSTAATLFSATTSIVENYAPAQFTNNQVRFSNYSTTNNGSNPVYLTSVLVGDPTGDGIVDISDAVKINQIVSTTSSDFGVPVGTNSIYRAADVNGNGYVESSDSQLLQQYIVKLIPDFTVCGTYNEPDAL